MSSEREIIKRLQEGRYRRDLVTPKSDERLTEARRSPFDVFFAQLEGTYNRLASINQEYNSPNQQEIINDYVLEPLEFLVVNEDVIKLILDTPQGQMVGVDLEKFMFESASECIGFRLTESKLSPLSMFFNELDELHARALTISRRVNDREQAIEFEKIVLSRIEYVLKVYDEIEEVLLADEDADLEGVVSRFKKMKPAQRVTTDPQVPMGFEEETKVEVLKILNELWQELGSDGETEVRKNGESFEISFRDDKYFTSRPGEEEDDWLEFTGYDTVLSIVEDKFKHLLDQVEISIQSNEKSWYTIQVMPVSIR